MKAILISTAALFTAIALPMSAHAANPAHVRQLLETRACASCDLSVPICKKPI